MSHADLIQAVRRLVVDALSQLRRDDRRDPREIILVRDGVYCGRRFEVTGGHAVWSFDDDQLEVFRPDGSVFSVIEHVSAGEPARRKAA
jgi:hypothetical protein